jgi:hypothetical protein
VYKRQLLTQVTIPGHEIGMEEGKKPVEQVLAAVRSMNILDAVIHRIEQSIISALINAVNKLKASSEGTLVTVSIYCPLVDCHAETTQGSSISTGVNSSQGWGFFLVERLESRWEAKTDPTQYTIELFLYSA